MQRRYTALCPHDEKSQLDILLTSVNRNDCVRQFSFAVNFAGMWSDAQESGP